MHSSVETTFVLVLAAIIVPIELYYWCWWFPRNYHKTREYQDLRLLKKMYGKNGDVWKLMKEGKL